MQLHEALLSPEAFPGPASASIQTISTHISWVFLREHDVYKVKRPVDLGFLDFRTPENRRLACEAEVALNRRLAPHVYLGVVPIGQTSDGRFHVDGPGAVVDWAVHMGRLPDAARADTLLEAGALSPARIDEVARRLSEFHRGAASGPHISSFGAPEQITHNVSENFVQTRDTIDHFLSKAAAAELENWQRDYLKDHSSLFRERVQRGHVRDGHGDLRLEHVYVEPSGVTILDCIEFNDRFRYADVCADVAFLSMDLEAAGRVDLAELLLARYARYENDFDLYGVVDFYESYRAFVRAKVASFTAADPTVDYPTRERAWRTARRYALLALSAKRSPLVPPLVVAVGGVIASGKSTLAERLGQMLAAPIVDTDRIRKHLAGRDALSRIPAPLFQGAYSERATEQVYRELCRRARVVLGSARPVVLEASFRTRAERARVRALAREHRVPFVFVECRAPAEVRRARLVERSSGPSVSDGRLEIGDAFAASFEAVNELDPSEHVILDTTRDLELNLNELKLRPEFG